MNKRRNKNGMLSKSISRKNPNELGEKDISANHSRWYGLCWIGKNSKGEWIVNKKTKEEFYERLKKLLKDGFNIWMIKK